MLLMTPQTFGTLTIHNRLVRSATAERMADDLGRPLKKMHSLYTLLKSKNSPEQIYH